MEIKKDVFCSSMGCVNPAGFTFNVDRPRYVKRYCQRCEAGRSLAEARNNAYKSGLIIVPSLTLSNGLIV